MGWVSGVTVYVIIWWVVLFAVLPWGVRSADSGEPGGAEGAPLTPRIGLKFLVTTIIAGLIWLAVDAVILSDVISFRDMARNM